MRGSQIIKYAYIVLLHKSIDYPLLNTINSVHVKRFLTNLILGTGPRPAGTPQDI